MNTASLELCEELYALSNWALTEKHWYKGKPIYNAPYGWDCPAYDLGYLLRKLPPEVSVDQFRMVQYGNWIAGYHDGDIFTLIEEADTPEDAVCMLCIELFKQKVLERE